MRRSTVPDNTPNIRREPVGDPQLPGHQVRLPETDIRGVEGELQRFARGRTPSTVGSEFRHRARIVSSPSREVKHRPREFIPVDVIGGALLPYQTRAAGRNPGRQRRDRGKPPAPRVESPNFWPLDPMSPAGTRIT